MVEIISREEARAKGLKRYFTGVPCARGHVCERYVISTACSICGCENAKKYQNKNRDKETERNKDYKKRNPEKVKGWKRKHYQKHKEEIAQKLKIKREANKEMFAARKKAWYEKNKERIIAGMLNRLKTDSMYRLTMGIRIRFYQALNKNYKSGSAVRDLGCSIDFLKDYLEKQFSSNMTWENYGSVWTVDHIIPLSRFDLTDRVQLLIACNYKNLQPLYASENMSKGALTMDEWLAIAS